MLLLPTESLSKELHCSGRHRCSEADTEEVRPLLQLSAQEPLATVMSVCLPHRTCQGASWVGTLWGASAVDSHLWITRGADQGMSSCGSEDVLEGIPPYVTDLVRRPKICEPLVGQSISTCVRQIQAFSGLDFASGSTFEVDKHVQAS